MYNARKEGKGRKGKKKEMTYLRAQLVNSPSRLVLISLGRAVGVLLHVYVAHRLSFHPSSATLLMLLLLLLPARRCSRGPPP